MEGDGDRHDLSRQPGSQLAASAGPAPTGARNTLEQPPTARRRRAVLCTGGALIAAAVLIVLAVVHSGPTAISSTAAAPSRPGPQAMAAGVVEAARPVSAAELAALPMATTFATISAAPPDPAPTAVPSGRLVHPVATIAAYTAPGGAAIAAVPPTELVSDTWLPVVAEQPGWVQVLLPSRPNGSTAWIVLDERVTSAQSSYRIVVDRAHFALSVIADGAVIGHWTVGVGKTGAVTPATRTFLLASIKDTHPTFSPIVLPTGAHSDTYQSYGGGPGTVGIHTWPDPGVYGRASSDGCIRVPPAALHVISTQVPIGSPVLIS
jgi:hypothetical protein